jgi:transposase
LNAITKELTTVCNDTYITSQQVCELFDKLVAQNVGVPITIVLDNARYQRCALVQDHASQLGIKLLFLPSYSPNLNLIERFWKYVKKECLYAHYYPAFKEFKQAISTCIELAPTRHKTKLHSLLTLRFQTFKSTAA